MSESRVFIAFLRGINVGGNRIIKMSELKSAFESIGLLDVKTVIQSGNVLFRSDNSEAVLQAKIENMIQSVWHFDVPVILRTAEALEQLIQLCPFTEAEIRFAESMTDKECLYVAIMARAPLEETVDRLKPYASELEAFRIIGRDVYLLFSQSFHNSKLANNLTKLSEPGTVRNWKTLNKLSILAKEMNVC